MNHQIFERKLRSVGVPLEHASFSVVSTNLSDVLAMFYTVSTGSWRVSNTLTLCGFKMIGYIRVAVLVTATHGDCLSLVLDHVDLAEAVWVVYLE